MQPDNAVDAGRLSYPTDPMLHYYRGWVSSRRLLWFEGEKEATQPPPGS